MSNMDYSTRTEAQTKIHTLIWTVPSFRKLLESKLEREFRTENPKDTSAESIDSRFQIKMQFLGRNNDIIEIYFLSPNSVFLKSVIFKYIWRCQESATIVVKKDHAVQGNKWQYLATLSKDYIKTCLNSSFSRSDGSLRFKFEFTITDDIKVDRSNVPGTQLSSDFENLLNSGMFSDVTMKSAEGNEFRVHKAILAGRSVVLKAHFEHNTIECKKKIVESQLEAEVLVEVLNFIYSEKAPRVNKIPDKLLAAADYYQLSGLKSLCEEALHKRLTVENAIETLQLADLYSTKILKRLTLEFIKDGQAKLITRTEGWANVKSVELIKTLYEYIMADDIEAD